MQNTLICITGPTASGKSALAVALARRLQTEIISVDSMQIYRSMDIGTAKPTSAERGGVPHHMLDVAEPGECYSVARFVREADACVQDVLIRGKVPIAAGGTGLYLDALIAGNTFAGNESDETIRERYRTLARQEGNEAVLERLRRVDPESAQRLHPNNLKRVIRALEVYETTGITIGALNARNRRAAPKYRACVLGLCPASRETLYERIDARVDQMMADGLLKETRALLQAGKLTGTAAQAIGYKELLAYIRGEAPLEACVELLKRRTRGYAKRQMTWLRRNPAVRWICYEEPRLPELLRRAEEELRAFDASLPL